VLADPADFARLYLFRHPAVEDRYQDLVVGSGDAELSRRGRSTVIDWRAALKDVGLARVVSGGQKQCLDPARALAADRKVEVEVDERLADQAMGEWQGRSWSELAEQDGARVRDFFQEFGEATPPGGESLGAAVERVVAWWGEARSNAAATSIALVLPGTLLTGFVAAMLGMRLSRCFSLRLPAGGLGVLDVYDNGVHLASWNALEPVGAER
jgi:broad specificity phosphatase PhoE